MIAELTRRSLGHLWADLPAVLAAGMILLAGTLPAVLAAAAGASALVVPALLPAALLWTGTTRFAAGLLARTRPGVRAALRLDPLLGLTLAGPLLIGGWLVQARHPVGFGLVALVLLAGPSAAAYATARGCAGLAAWRGGLLLVAYRPSWALTVAAVGVLAAFAGFATGGVLLPPAMILVALLAAGVTEHLLAEIDRTTA